MVKLSSFNIQNKFQAEKVSSNAAISLYFLQLAAFQTHKYTINLLHLAYYYLKLRILASSRGGTLPHNYTELVVYTNLSRSVLYRVIPKLEKIGWIIHAGRVWRIVSQDTIIQSLYKKFGEGTVINKHPINFEGKRIKALTPIDKFLHYSFSEFKGWLNAALKSYKIEQQCYVREKGFSQYIGKIKTKIRGNQGIIQLDVSMNGRWVNYERLLRTGVAHTKQEILDVSRGREIPKEGICSSIIYSRQVGKHHTTGLNWDKKSYEMRLLYKQFHQIELPSSSFLEASLEEIQGWWNIQSAHTPEMKGHVMWTEEGKLVVKMCSTYQATGITFKRRSLKKHSLSGTYKGKTA